MYLVGKKHTTQAVTKDKKTHFFDDIGCMILWLEENHNDEDAVLWVYTLDTQRYIKAEDAFYSRDDKTPMLYGFGVYEKSKDSLISFKQMRLKMLRGETLQNPKIRQQILLR